MSYNEDIKGGDEKVEKNELCRLLAEKEKEFETAKLKRMIITILVFSAVFFLLLYFAEYPTGLEIIGMALASIFLGGLSFFVNAVVFTTLFRRSETEKKVLEFLRKKISEIE